MTNTSAEATLNFLNKAHDQAVELAESIVFKKESALHRTTIALYSSIIELSGTCCLLIDNKQGVALPIVLRAIIEAHVDLVNMLQTQRYGYYLELDYVNQWLVILQEAKRGKNEYLADISVVPSLDETIKDFTEQKLKLKSDGYEKLKIENKFIRADMEKEYRSIYNNLCAHAHNNIRALMDRHFEREQGDLSVVLYKEYNLEDNQIYIGFISEILIRATENIHKKFQTNVVNQVQLLRDEINLLRGDSA